MYGLTEVPSDDTQTGGETGDGETGGETGDGGTGGDTGGDTGEVVENKECLTTVSDVAVVYDSNNEEKYLFNYTSGKEHNSERLVSMLEVICSKCTRYTSNWIHQR